MTEVMAPAQTKKRRPAKTIIAAAALLCANLLFFLSIWLGNKYDHVTLDQFIYQMKTSAAGADSSLVNSAVFRVGVLGVGLTALETLFWLLCAGKLPKWREKLRWKLHGMKFGRFLKRRALPLALAGLVLSLSFFTVKMNVVDYVKAMVSHSDFIDRHYVDPGTVKLTFPEEKRNLIYIFLESMEVTFAQTQAGGPITDDFIPELTALAAENVNFSHTGGLGGALSFEGATWTAASMVAQTCGVTVQVPLGADNFGGEDSYLPGVVSIGEILQEQGYRNTLLVGSDAEFADRETYFTEHGGYDIVDINALKEQGRLEEDYKVWWGFEDEKLFGFAKEELLRLAASGQPFNLTMLTADTHFPDGYVCENCSDEYEEQYPNVLRCSSRQVAEFIAWVQVQDFYENTTIVLCGDHLTMDPDFLEDADENYTRTIYNCVLNAAVEPAKEKNRQFGVYDMFPTTLGAMGVKITGERLGLGTNLFSRHATLTEQYDYEFLNAELQKYSELYSDVLLEISSQSSG